MTPIQLCFPWMLGTQSTIQEIGQLKGPWRPRSRDHDDDVMKLALNPNHNKNLIAE